MDLLPHLTQLRRDLLAAADTGTEDAVATAERLVAVLDPAARLVMLDVLVEAAGELTRDLAPGGVEVRLRGRDVELVVSRPAEAPTPSLLTKPAEADPADGDDDGGTARLSLRLPERLKARVDQAAESAGLSVNAWLVRSIGGLVDAPGAGAPAAPPVRPSAGQRQTGWVR